MSVALSGGVLVIGDLATSAAYVFATAGASFAYQATLTTSVFGSFFGDSVAVSGNRIAVGSVNDVNNAGAVYLFEQVQGAWTQTAKLTASDAASADEFGSAVALSGDRLVVGAPGIAQGAGAAYVFDRVSGAWSQTARLVAADTTANASLGTAVALDSGRVFVGAPNAVIGTGLNGAAYLFTCSAGSCSQTVKLVPGQSEQQLYFGTSVALLGSRALVGAPNVLGDPNVILPGHAVVFDYDGAAWQRTVTWSGGSVYGFGTAVALAPARAVVGAPLNTDIIQPGFPGYIFVFDHGSGGWTNTEMLSPGAATDTMSIDFGRTLGFDGNVIVGAPIETAWHSNTMLGAGAVVQFTLASPVAVPAGGPLLSIAVALALLALGVRRQRGIASLMPPSTLSTPPLVKADRGETRKRAASATARGGMGPTPSRLRRR
jgi:hypothetical protein